MSAIRGKSAVAVAGLVGTGLLASGCGLFGGGGSSKQDAGQSVATSAASPSDPVTSVAASGTPSDPGTATSAPTSGGPTTVDSSSPGAYASDKTTPLSSFPSLSKVDTALGSQGHVVSTIDVKYQKAAAGAVTAKLNSSMVVIDASTGNILAMASSGAVDAPYFTELAPGSTFKVITTEDLLRNGLSETSPASCPPVGEYGITNDDTQTTNANANLEWAFTRSCNTSYVGLASKLDNSPLDTEAATYFGLNKKWDLGLGGAAYYGTAGSENVPKATNDGFAREMFGQDKITMSPLNMASVAATVANGRFRQPVLIPGHTPTATATPLDSGVDSTLKDLMYKAVTEGTATSLRNLGKVGAKTGTAQPGGNAPNNSWMIAFRGNIAVACLVVGGNHGDESAGPEIATMFQSVGAS